MITTRVNRICSTVRKDTTKVEYMYVIKEFIELWLVIVTILTKARVTP